MSSINYRRLCETARSPLPVRGQPGCFQLFLSNPLVIDPSQTVAVDVGLLVRMVDGYYPMVVSDQTSMSRGLMVNNFNTMTEADSLNKDNHVCKLEFNIYNTGPIRVALDAGSEIARLVLLQTGDVKLVECDQFSDDPNFKRERPVNEIAAIPKTDGVWFKRQYKEDVNKCFTQFFDTPEGRNYMTEIELMRETAEYQHSRDKSLFEAKWVYEHMPPEIKKNVIEQFNNYKKDFVKENRK